MTKRKKRKRLTYLLSSVAIVFLLTEFFSPNYFAMNPLGSDETILVNDGEEITPQENNQEAGDEVAEVTNEVEQAEPPIVNDENTQTGNETEVTAPTQEVDNQDETEVTTQTPEIDNEEKAEVTAPTIEVENKTEVVAPTITIDNGSKTEVTTPTATVDSEQGQVGENGPTWELLADGTLVVAGGTLNWQDQVSPWNDNKDKISKIVFTESIQAGNSLAHLFDGLSNVITIEGLTNFDTSNTTDISAMFANMNNLTSLDLSSFQTNSVTNMTGMFANDTNLAAITFSNFTFTNDVALPENTSLKKWQKAGEDDLLTSSQLTTVGGEGKDGLYSLTDQVSPDYEIQAHDFTVTTNQVADMDILQLAEATASNTLNTTETVTPIIKSGKVEEKSGEYEIVIGINQDENINKTIKVIVTEDEGTSEPQVTLPEQEDPIHPIGEAPTDQFDAGKMIKVTVPTHMDWVIDDPQGKQVVSDDFQIINESADNLKVTFDTKEDVNITREEVTLLPPDAPMQPGDYTLALSLIQKGANASQQNRLRVFDKTKNPDIPGQLWEEDLAGNSEITIRWYGYTQMYMVAGTPLRVIDAQVTLHFSAE